MDFFEKYIDWIIAGICIILWTLIFLYIHGWGHKIKVPEIATPKDQITLAPWQPGHSTGTPMTWPTSTPAKHCYQLINETVCQ